MTTNYHTAISVGAAANAATFNTPLGALDAAITNTQSGVYNVLEYGATGDGSTDDTTSIQAAITAAGAAGGGTVFVPENTYLISSAVSLAANVSLVGQGATTIIKHKAGSGFIILVVNTLSNVQISNLAIDGNKANVSGDSWGIELITPTNVTVRDCSIYNCTDVGIRGVGTHTNVIIANNHITGIGETGCSNGQGIHITDDIDGLLITGNEIDTTYTDGILVNRDDGTAAVGVRVTDNYVDAAGAIGIYVVATYGAILDGNTAAYCITDGIEMATSYAGVMSNNSAIECTVDGIVLDSCTLCTLSGNSALGNGANGILLQDSDRVAVTGNLSSLNNVAEHSSPPCSGIMLYEATTYCTVTGNVCSDTGDANANQKHGIAEYSDDEDTIPDFNLIAHNMLLGNVTSSILRYTGAGTTGATKIKGNWGYVTENNGVYASAVDAGTIAHGCVTTPTGALVVSGVTGHFASVTGLDATNITIALRNHDNTAISSGETVYWQAWV